MKQLLKYIFPVRFRKLFTDKNYAFFISSKFSEIKFDEQGWRTIVPEPVAKIIANPLSGKKILDVYAGVGGTAIQFALAGNKVTALEINPKRFLYLQHNCRVYGVDKNVKLYCTSAEDFKASGFDVVFLDPPWQNRSFDPKSFVEKYGNAGKEIIFKLPKEMDDQLIFSSGATKVLQAFINHSLFVKVAYYFPKTSSCRTVEKQVISYPKLDYIFP